MNGAPATSQDTSISDRRQGRFQEKIKGKGPHRDTSPLPPPPPGWKPRHDARGRGLEKAIRQAREYHRDKLRRAAKREREEAKETKRFTPEERAILEESIDSALRARELERWRDAWIVYSAPPSPTPESAEEDQLSYLATQSSDLPSSPTGPTPLPIPVIRREQLHIPWDIVGYINGPERSNITEFQRLSGAKITIESNSQPGALVHQQNVMVLNLNLGQDHGLRAKTTVLEPRPWS
ncbi:hypothetical protein BD310DRAFT_979161 [Dichomitus squalens]|uniref:K Homology domain-containing protein n=1 Tax=Dichomitus squalens TaxID=114155 RepID=A0A4Q9PP60_9APHY|nr:hypothetical protein BD310DRAFT_979161 [Dichomitus squalens]